LSVLANYLLVFINELSLECFSNVWGKIKSVVHAGPMMQGLCITDVCNCQVSVV